MTDFLLGDTAPLAHLQALDGQVGQEHSCSVAVRQISQAAIKQLASVKKRLQLAKSWQASGSHDMRQA